MSTLLPVPANSHWFPAALCIDFKLLLIPIKALNGVAPNYIMDLITSTGQVSLRSVDGAVYTHDLWRNLPESTDRDQTADIYGVF